MPSLILKRDGFYFAALRRLKIKIDGKMIVSLRLAEERTIELDAGQHVLIAQMDWCKSRPLTISLSENEQIYVVAGLVSQIWAFIGCFVPPFRIFTLKEISREPSKKIG